MVRSRGRGALAFEDFLTLPRDSIPVLESLQLSVIQDFLVPNLSIPDSNFGVFRGAARLRRIDMIPRWDRSSVYFPMNLGLCWPQLTHINFEGIPIQVSIAHELMKLCTSLHNCVLHLMTDGRVKVAFPVAGIHLPRLQKLFVKEAGPDPNILAKFIRPQVLPALQDFDLYLERTSLADIAPIIEDWSTSRGPARSRLNYAGRHLAEIGYIYPS